MPFNKEAHDQQQCGFFRLPPELRDTINRMILTRDAPISPQRTSHRKEEAVVLQLLQTCQRMNIEARKIYFGNNTFRFYDDGELQEELPRFLRDLIPESLRFCAKLSLEGSLGLQPRQAKDLCGRQYCVGSMEIDFTAAEESKMVTTIGRTNCCDQQATEILERAREKVQHVLSGVGNGGGLNAEVGASLGSEVAIEFASVFESLHPDYGD